MKRCVQKHDSILDATSNEYKASYCDAALSFEILDLRVEPRIFVTHAQNCFKLDQIRVAFSKMIRPSFFLERIFESAISFGRKHNTNGLARNNVGCCMGFPVSKFNVQLRNTDRCTAIRVFPPVYGWPSS